MSHEKAEACAKAGDHEGAVKAYGEVLAGDPKNVAALVNRATSFMQLRKFDEALADLDAAIRLDGTIWPAFMNRGELHAAFAKALESDPDPNAALRRWRLAQEDGEHVAKVRDDLPFGYQLAGRALEGQGRFLEGYRRWEQSEMFLREALAVYNRGMGMMAPDSDEFKQLSEKVVSLRNELLWRPPEGSPSDQKAKAEYMRIGVLLELLPVQRAADWLDNDLPGPEGSEPVSSQAISSGDPRAFVARKLKEVPGWCTKGLPGKAWLGHLALGFDQKMYAAEEFTDRVRRLYDAGYLAFDEAPYHGVVLKKVESGISPINVLRMALDPHVSIAQRFVQTGQLEG